MEQSIHLTSVGNARELGGLVAGGKMIKKGCLLRTAALSAISSEDKAVLEKEYRVAAIVDLRMGMERAETPDPELSNAKNVFLPVMECEDYPDFDEESARMLTDPNADRFELIKKSYEMGMMGENLYVDFLFSERGKTAYRAFFKCLLELPEGRSILWHCTDGKDRTGVASMLILTALGADRETILHDYMLTNTYNEKKLVMARAGLENAPIPDELKELALFGAGAVIERFMINAINAMEERCGSPMEYLAKELGVGPAEIERLRMRFLTENEV